VGIANVLVELRANDKQLREKLLVLQMAKERGWPAAEKLSRRINGEYANPHVAKVMEEEDKQREKDRKEKEKTRFGAMTKQKSYPRYHQQVPYNILPYRSFGHASGFAQGSGYHQRSGIRQQFQQRYSRDSEPEGKKCFRCGKTGHLVGECRERPKFT
jgi:hypothetical protein